MSLQNLIEAVRREPAKGTVRMSSQDLRVAGLEAERLQKRIRELERELEKATYFATERKKITAPVAERVRTAEARIADEQKAADDERQRYNEVVTTLHETVATLTGQINDLREAHRRLVVECAAARDYFGTETWGAFRKTRGSPPTRSPDA